MITSVSSRSTELIKYTPHRHFLWKELLKCLAQDLPNKLSFPFSGVVAFQVGDDFLVEAAHCPHQPAFTPAQTFNTLSVGKLFTAVAVMQLIEDRRFLLCTPLSALLEGHQFDVPLHTPYLEQKPNSQSLESLKRYADIISVFHLLSHTLGFPENSGELKDHYLDADFSYQLLASIIGKYTRCCDPSVVNHEARFIHHIQERIFKPACMETALRESRIPTTKKPDCFEISLEGYRLRITPPEPYPHGNGGFRMTARDVLAFIDAVRRPNMLIKESSFQTLLNYRGGGHYGFCVDRDLETREVTGYGHSGSGPGMSSFLYTWETDPPITCVLLSNYSGCEHAKLELDALLKKFTTTFQKGIGL